VKATAVAQRFLELYRILEDNGVEGLGGRNIHFWSGDFAKMVLTAPYKRTTDVKIPVNRTLLVFTRSLYPKRKEEQDLYEVMRYRFISAMSRQLASQACGDVYVFISDTGGSENEKKLSVGNYFWNAELPVLQAGKLKGQVNKIQLCFEDCTVFCGFAQPIEWSSPESDAITLVRVHKVPAEESSSSSPYSSVKQSYTMEPVETPCHLTLGDLRRIIAKWRKIAGKRGSSV
jgi:hypothetical protein